MFYSFVTKHACDRQNDDPQDRDSIAALRRTTQRNSP